MYKTFLRKFYLYPSLPIIGAILALSLAIASPIRSQGVNRSLTVRSDIQEADSKTGIITARGNVQIDYPARQMQATSAQAQYFTKERRIVLSGNVFVLQNGNTIRGEVVTYLIDEGRFIALPPGKGQVESIYLVPAEQEPNPLATP
jgi:lipopolysaccharide export system protein LptA